MYLSVYPRVMHWLLPPHTSLLSCSRKPPHQIKSNHHTNKQVLVSVGKRVNADDPLCVVVAMKMEVVVKAPVSGESCSL